MNALSDITQFGPLLLVLPGAGRVSPAEMFQPVLAVNRQQLEVWESQRTMVIAQEDEKTQQ